MGTPDASGEVWTWEYYGQLEQFASLEEARSTMVPMWGDQATAWEEVEEDGVYKGALWYMESGRWRDSGHRLYRKPRTARWVPSPSPGHEFLVDPDDRRLGYVLNNGMAGYAAFTAIFVGYVQVPGVFASAHDAKLAVVVKTGLQPQTVPD